MTDNISKVKIIKDTILIKNVNATIMDIFEVTGFSDLVEIE